MLSIRRSKSQKCMMLASSMSSMTHVKHIEQNTLKMYLKIYKYDFYSAEKNFYTFLVLTSLLVIDNMIQESDHSYSTSVLLQDVSAYNDNSCLIIYTTINFL